MKQPPIRSLQPLQTTTFSFSVHPGYAWATICFVFILSLLRWRVWPGTPDLLLLLLAFWCAHEIRGVGMLTGFLFGLLMDVQDTTLLGQHALTYVLVLFGIKMLRRRMLQFSVGLQIIYLFPIFVLAPIPAHLIAFWLNATHITWSWLWSGVFNSLLWIIADIVLRLPFGLDADDDATI